MGYAGSPWLLSFPCFCLAIASVVRIYRMYKIHLLDAQQLYESSPSPIPTFSTARAHGRSSPSRVLPSSIALKRRSFSRLPPNSPTDSEGILFFSSSEQEHDSGTPAAVSVGSLPSAITYDPYVSTYPSPGGEDADHHLPSSAPTNPHSPHNFTSEQQKNQSNFEAMPSPSDVIADGRVNSESMF